VEEFNPTSSVVCMQANLTTWSFRSCTAYLSQRRCRVFCRFRCRSVRELSESDSIANASTRTCLISNMHALWLLVSVSVLSMASIHAQIVPEFAYVLILRLTALAWILVCLSLYPSKMRRGATFKKTRSVRRRHKPPQRLRQIRLALIRTIPVIISRALALPVLVLQRHSKLTLPKVIVKCQMICL